jgi:hypothetical protein
LSYQAFWSRLPEYVMGTDPTPDDVRLSLDLLFSVLERCSAIVGPCHLEDATGSLDTFDAKALTERSLSLQIFHKPIDGKAEPPLVFGRQRRVILLEPIGFSISRQALGLGWTIRRGSRESPRPS